MEENPLLFILEEWLTAKSGGDFEGISSLHFKDKGES